MIPFSCSVTLSILQLRTQSISHSTHSYIHSITQSITLSLTQLHHHSIIHSLVHCSSSTHSLDHTLTRCDLTNHLQAIESEKVTIFKTGSALVRQLVSSQSAPKLKKMNLSSLKWGTFCAEPVSLDAQEFAVRHLCKNFMNSYVISVVVSPSIA